MKKIMSGIIVITAVVLCLAGCGEPSVTIVNNTGFDIYFLYVSHANSDGWEEDVLGNNILENGNSIQVSLPRGGRWDIKLEDEDGDSYTKYGIKANSQTVFTLDDLD